MGFFKRKNRILDLTKRYEKQQVRVAPQAYPETFSTEMSTRGKEMKQDNSGGFGFFGAIANTVSQSANNDAEYVDISSSAEEKKRKLAKRLMDMTNKIEELSNQIYHLQQRIEVLEQKLRMGNV